MLEASELVIERGKRIASVVLEAAVSDIEFAKGRFTIAGTDRSVGLMELAAMLHKEFLSGQLYHRYNRE